MTVASQADYETARSVLLRSQGRERPLRFQLNDHEYLVEEVLDQWYGPEHAFFKLLADDGNL